MTTIEKPALGLLTEAAKTGDVKAVEYLLRDGADIEEIRNPFMSPNTPLIVAAWYDKTETACLLIEKGADINRYGGGDTALTHASFNGNVKIVSLLISKGAKLDLKDAQGETALIRAAVNGRVEVARMLIDAGASLDNENNKGETAHSIAVARSHSAIAGMIAQAAEERRLAKEAAEKAARYASPRAQRLRALKVQAPKFKLS